MSENQKHIFLCHGSFDKEFFQRMVADLEKLRVEVWLDEWKLAIGDS